MSLFALAAYAGGAAKINGPSASSYARGTNSAADLGSQLYDSSMIAPSRSEAAARGSAVLGLFIEPSNSTKAGLMHEVLNQDRAVMGDLAFTVSGGGAFGSYDDFYTAGVIESLPDLAEAVDYDMAAFTDGFGGGPGPPWSSTISVAATADPVLAPEPPPILPYGTALILLGFLRWQAERQARHRVGPGPAVKA